MHIYIYIYIYRYITAFLNRVPQIQAHNSLGLQTGAGIQSSTAKRLCILSHML